jgi:hypothetical protein
MRQFDCADENTSLPTVGQLLLARNELGNVDAGGEWTDSHQMDDVLGELANVVSSAGVVSSVSRRSTALTAA